MMKESSPGRLRALMLLVAVTAVWVMTALVASSMSQTRFLHSKSSTWKSSKLDSNVPLEKPPTSSGPTLRVHPSSSASEPTVEAHPSSVSPQPAGASTNIVESDETLPGVSPNIRDEQPAEPRSSPVVTTQAEEEHQQALDVLPPMNPLPPGRQAVRRGDYNPFWLLVSRKRKLAVTFVPKVMCSSIRAAMRTIECGDPNVKETVSSMEHNRRCVEARRNPTIRSAPLTNMTRVVVFRDPFERLYSAYANSNTNKFINLKHCQNAKQCSFEEWVEEMSSDGGKYAMENEHFKPQSTIAQFGAMHYHYKLRLSSPADQQFFWQELMGTNPLMKNVHETKNATQAPAATTVVAPPKSSVMEIYQKLPRSTFDKIATMYKKDLELWQDVLDNGTPRTEGEEQTVYDYYMSLASEPEEDHAVPKLIPPRIPLASDKPAVQRSSYNPFWLLVSKKRHLAVTFVPKVMCSSIRAALRTLECGNPARKQTRLSTEQMRRCVEARRNPNLAQHAPLGNMTRIIFFRDPFERLYSAYANSNGNKFIYLRHCQNATMCSFEQWVDEMGEDGGRYAFRNEHFKPQSTIAQLDAMHYHYQLRLSSAADQKFFWQELMGTDPLMENVHKSKNATTSAAPKTTTVAAPPKSSVLQVYQNLPQATFDKIARMYQKDLELWQNVLDHGTPRVEGQEQTVYDYYVSLLQESRR